MARTSIPVIVLDPDTTDFVEGASVTVQTRPGGSTAVVYTTETGSTPATQPLSTDAEGKVDAWADRGRYQLLISVPGHPDTLEYFDAAPGQDGGIDSAWLATGAVTAAKLGAGSVGSSALGAGSVSTTSLGADVVTQAKMADASIGTNELVDNAVTANKLRSDVTIDSNRSVTSDHLRDASITTGKLADVSVTNDKIPNSEIITALINDGAVTLAKLAANSVNASKIVDGSVGTAELADLGVTTAKIANNTIGGGKLNLSVIKDSLNADDASLATGGYTTECQVTPVADATYLVIGQVAFSANNATVANVRILVDGVASFTQDQISLPNSVNTTTVVPIVDVVTPTSTTTIKLQAQREGGTTITVLADQLTRLVAVRIG